MVKLPNLPYSILNIEGISIASVAKWLNKPYHDTIIQNKVGNRIIYPQAVAVDKEQLEIDLAILREKLKVSHQEYYRPLAHRLLIPEDLSLRYPDLPKLVWAFIDAFRPLGITTLTLESGTLGYKNLGCIIHPEVILAGAVVELSVGGKKYSTSGGVVIIPAPLDKQDIEFRSNTATLLGKSSLVTEVSGGSLGIILDTRK